MNMRTHCQYLLLFCAVYYFRVSHSETIVSQETGSRKLNIQESSGSATAEERFARCTTRSKKPHLKTHDADRVAKYFINGGPLIGHAHFRGHQDTDHDEDQYHPNYSVGMPNFPNQNYNPPTGSISPYGGTNTPTVGAPQIPMMHHTPHILSNSNGYSHNSYSPYVPYNEHNPYKPNFLLHPPFTQSYVPETSGLVGSALNQLDQASATGVYNIPNTMLRLPVIPLQGNLATTINAASGGGESVVGSSNPIPASNGNDNLLVNKDTPMVGAPQTSSTPTTQQSNAVFEALIPHIPNQIHVFPQSFYSANPYHTITPQPSGYILRLIPQNPQASSTTPRIGSQDTNSNTENDTPSLGKSQPKQTPKDEPLSDDDEVYEDAKDTNDNEEDGAEESNTDCTITKREEPRKDNKKPVTPSSIILPTKRPTIRQE